eukprot:5863517-Amphidinium_carterae.2
MKVKGAVEKIMKAKVQGHTIGNLDTPMGVWALDALSSAFCNPNFFRTVQRTLLPNPLPCVNKYPSVTVPPPTLTHPSHNPNNQFKITSKC